METKVWAGLWSSGDIQLVSMLANISIESSDVIVLMLSNMFSVNWGGFWRFNHLGHLSVPTNRKGEGPDLGSIKIIF